MWTSWASGWIRTIRQNPNLRTGSPNIFWCRETNPSWGCMSPKLKALAESSHHIGWQRFTKGYISMHFYEIQTVHLAMSSSYLNGLDWTKQFITKILQITHPQWIYQKSCFTTNVMATSTTRSQKSWWWRWSPWQIWPQRMFQRQAVFWSKSTLQKSQNLILKLRNTGV